MKQIDKLIINSPFEEPRCHWYYDREHRVFEKRPGRRPAGYVIATPSSRGFDDPGLFIEIALVEKIRPRVKAWREKNDHFLILETKGRDSDLVRTKRSHLQGMGEIRE